MNLVADITPEEAQAGSFAFNIQFITLSNIT